MHADSARWAAHCERLCRELDVPLRTAVVDAAASAGESPEAAARDARYAALAASLGEGEVLLTAHHAGDQAETLLLQLLRGAGPAGLAAMPALARFAAGWLARPLLSVSKAALQDYCRARSLDWLEDPANESGRHDRSYLRHVVMPALTARWPATEATLGRAATHQACARQLLEALGREDLVRPPAPAAAALPDLLPVATLSALPRPRRENALRCWLVARGAEAPSAAQLRRMLDDVVDARPDAGPAVRFGSHELRRHGGRLHLCPAGPAPRFEPTPWPDPSRPLRLGHGRLRGERVTGAGVRASVLEAGGVEVRPRRGGERLRPCGDAHTRELKKLLHASGMPPWERVALPLVYAGGRLVAVPGVCVAAADAAAAGEPGLVLRWQPDDGGG